MLKTIAKFTDTLINIAMGAIIDFANVEISKKHWKTYKLNQCKNSTYP